ncbi:MAG TPA: hypothetical protein VFO19_06590 [Vicinamibacterales bacterium]|nr:hypothetical protein [Vicinamibacterales bacterium]
MRTKASRRIILFAAAVLLTATPAAAQRPERPWSADFSIGWDNSISGNVLSAGVGTVFDLATVVDDKSYDDIYGTGVRWAFGVGYRIRERRELRAAFTFSTVSADSREIGTAGGAPLFANFDDYSVWGLDFGYRQYLSALERAPRVTPYFGGNIGVNVINEIDADLAVPALNLTRNATDFYDGTAAFTFEFNGGTLITVHPRVDLDLRLGLRFVTGLSDVDGLVGTGLEDINDDSGRWILPFTVGVRFKF